jgi:predicted nucleic acid-binding protein
MKLDEVPGGSIYVDTNILYMYLRADPTHLSILTTFFRRVVRGAFEAFVGIPVLDELFYRLLLARVRDATGRNPLDVLREDLVGTIRMYGGTIDTALRRLVAFPHLHLVGVESVDFAAMLEHIRTASLLPRDALHVAIIQRVGLAAIASDDADFDRVATITRHWVINPPAGT